MTAICSTVNGDDQRLKTLCQQEIYSEACIKRPRLGQKKKWSLNRGGLLIEVKMHCKTQLGHDQ